MKLFAKLLMTFAVSAAFWGAVHACELLIENDGANPILITNKRLTAEQAQQQKGFFSTGPGGLFGPGTEIGVNETKAMDFEVLETFYVYEHKNGQYEWKANVLPLECPAEQMEGQSTVQYRAIIGEFPQPYYLEINGKRSPYAPVKTN